MYPYDTPQQQMQDQLQKLIMPQLQTPTQQKHVVKVNGRAGAESYTMPPNSDDILLDQNDPIVWFVQTDGAGYKTVTPYDIMRHKETSQQDTIKSIEERLTKLEEAMKNGKSNHAANYAKPKPEQQHYDAGNRGNA